MNVPVVPVPDTSHAEGEAATRENTVDVSTLLANGSQWTAFQKGVLVLTALAVVLDGFDNQLLGFAIPAITQDLNGTPERFASIIAVSLVMMSMGTAIGGALGDWFGRKTIMLASMVIFALGTGAAGLAQDLEVLAWARWAAAIGLGACMPNATAMLADYTPLSRRSFAVTLGIIGVPTGGLMAGLIAAPVLSDGSWRLLFFIGAALPLVLALVMIFALPEAPQFLARNPTRHARLLEILAKCAVAPAPGTRIVPPPRSTSSASVLEIFRSRYVWGTLGLWVAFVSCLFSVYLVFSWAPSMLDRSGFGSADASLGLASFNFGGMAGAVLGGWLMDRFGPIRPLAASAVCAVLLALCLGGTGLDASREVWMIAGMGVLGVFVNGSQTMLFALGAHIYGPECRGTGVGMALAVGRIGAIASSFAGAMLLSTGSGAYFGVIASAMVLAVAGLAIIAYAQR